MQIRIDRTSTEALSAQIARQVRLLVAMGRLPPGRRLPPARELAARLEVNFHTVRVAYGELAREGLVKVAGRSGTRIASSAVSLVLGDVWRWRRIHALVEQLADEIDGSRVAPEAAQGVVASELRRVLHARAAERRMQRSASLLALPGPRRA